MNDEPDRPFRLVRRPPEHSVLFANEGSSGPDGEPPGHRGERNWIPWIAALIVIVVIVGIVLFISIGSSGAGSKPAGTPAYADHLSIGNLKISRASNFAGNQLTYVDGTIANLGNRTVTAATARVTFSSLDPSEPPQVEQAPVRLIRMRQPYVDTEPLSAAPLKPGTSRDFRLIFDGVSPMWNQHIPAVQVERAVTQP